jgi:hypothetical protein
MAQIDDARKTVPDSPGRVAGQVVILTVTLAIIAAGLWSLYMTDAPYHPDPAGFSQDTAAD